MILTAIIYGVLCALFGYCLRTLQDMVFPYRRNDDNDTPAWVNDHAASGQYTRRW